jgi:bis(5'-nucleosidyl)-tetraphosphatase
MIKDASYGIIPLQQQRGQWMVLLIHHLNGNHWGFPKGHKDEGESDFEAACRELKEETGLLADRCVQEEPFVETFEFRRRGQKVEKTVSYFVATVNGEVAIQQEEIREARWLSFADAENRLTFNEARLILTSVRELMKELGML